METMTRETMSEKTIPQLAQLAVSRRDAYQAQYTRRGEDYAPAADLCSTVFHEYTEAQGFHEYTEAQGFSDEHFQRGTVGRILRQMKAILGV